ncbi:hypothetical protein [Microbacterium testaceum]|uniref:hypothetical protein n=1 Tax=Microbacterium testaceum TaxID=2033 RepID=UPI001245162B|nr:hypothetical protein [Microbacterium testaceum]
MRMSTAAPALVAAGIVLACAAATGVAPAPVAGAPTAEVVRADPLSDELAAPLLADCSSITENGRGYARIHGIDLCGADTTPLSQPLRTEAVGGEECGSATLTMTSRGGGLAAIDWRVSSESGPIVAVELDLSFASHSGGEMRHVSDRSPSVHARGGTVAFLGVGRATATLSGSVETFTATCRIVPASVRILVR